MNQELDKQLERFGYSKKWLESGILSEKGFSDQIESQSKSTDLNYEHFRLASLRSWLRSRSSASDHEIKNLSEIILSDPDPKMAGSALAEIIDLPWLTDSQFQYLAECSKAFGDWIEKRISRSGFFRELDKGKLSPELFEKGLRLKDALIHARLISHPQISKIQLELISRQGANPEIRSKATAALRKNRDDSVDD